MPSRRDFLKYTGASALLVASSDLVGELIAQSPARDPMQSPFKGLSDIALTEAKRAGCTYADVRFTRSVSSSANANGGSDRTAAEAGADEAAAAGGAVEAGAVGAAAPPALACASSTAASGASRAVRS